MGTSREETLAKERSAFEQKVASASQDEDPLATYVEYIQWIVNNYGENNSSHPQSGLKAVLKQATDAFRKDPAYKTDLRYLKLWTLYAKQLDRNKAITVYKFLYKKDIGCNWSLLYEEYAAVLEEDNKCVIRLVLLIGMLTCSCLVLPMQVLFTGLEWSVRLALWRD
jgi:checkpoint serine/threonine-protein kinase